MFVPLMTM